MWSAHNCRGCVHGCRILKIYLSIILHTRVFERSEYYTSIFQEILGGCLFVISCSTWAFFVLFLYFFYLNKKFVGSKGPLWARNLVCTEFRTTLSRGPRFSYLWPPHPKIETRSPGPSGLRMFSISKFSLLKYCRFRKNPEVHRVRFEHATCQPLGWRSDYYATIYFWRSLGPFGQIWI